MAPRPSERVSVSVRSLSRSFALVCLSVGCLTLGVSHGRAADAPIPNMTVRPGIGKPELFPEDKIKPGMKGVAWTVFEGNDARSRSGRDHRRFSQHVGTAPGHHHREADR